MAGEWSRWRRSTKSRTESSTSIILELGLEVETLRMMRHAKWRNSSHFEQDFMETCDDHVFGVHKFAENSLIALNHT